MTNLSVHLGGKTALRFALSLLSLAPCLTAFATDADIPRLEAGAQRGSIKQEIQLASAYFAGRGVQRNEEQAAYWYEKAASAGDPVAQEEIGYFYQVGIGVQRDPVRAVHWYQLAAAGGLANAKMNLAIAYLWGIGIPQNQTFALALLREAAAKNSAAAVGFLGDAYYFGVGTEKDVTAAEHWWTVGTRMHDPRSQFRLAGLFSAGVGHKQDLPKAVELLRAAQDTGFVPAKHALGLLLANHPELASVPAEPVRLLEDAAAAGTWKSSAVLGALARDGRFMPADPKTAYLHFRIAQLQGGEEARLVVATDLSILSGKISDGDVQDMNAQADKWVKEHPLSLEFVYKEGTGRNQYPAFALTTPNLEIHAGRLIPVSGSTD